MTRGTAMRHLFSEAGRAAMVAALRADPLLAFDFDGTLAPIVARPDDACVSAVLAAQLDRLARLRPLAIITGRAVSDVAPRLGFAPRFIVGNHGAEMPGVAPRFDMAALERLRARVAAGHAALADAGVVVEDKRYSLALHYRQAPDRRRARDRIDAVLAGLEPELLRVPGKSVCNVVCAGAPDKGDAVVALARQAGGGSVIFAGDDRNDESVFARAQPDWLTVRVGRDDPRSRAAFFLEDQSEVLAFLQQLAGLMEAG